MNSMIRIVGILSMLGGGGLGTHAVTFTSNATLVSTNGSVEYLYQPISGVVGFRR